MALIGVLNAVGIVVKNGIVLVDYTILCRERGMSIVSSVITAGKSRLRPVLMTSVSTILGMIPMAIGQGEGSEMWALFGYYRCLGTFGFDIDYLDYCAYGLLCLCREWSET
jgi:HAE1 family hydrophobic/amphiphilic exporter-1